MEARVREREREREERQRRCYPVDFQRGGVYKLSNVGGF